MNIMVNYATQGGSSIIATSAFERCAQELRNLGIDVMIDGIVHDSTTQQVPIEKLFEAYLCYNRYFRKLTKDRFDADLKFDIDISINSRDNCVFTFDIYTKTFFLKGQKESVDHIMKYLGKPGIDIEIISDEVKEKHVNEFSKWCQRIDYASHSLCDSKIFESNGERTISGKVLRYVEGETETIENKPIQGLVHYWDYVKKWYEHKIPLNPGDDYVYTLRPVYTYFIKSGQPIIYQAKQIQKENMYFIPYDYSDNPKACPIDKLIPCNDNTIYQCIEERYGLRVYAKIPYKENFIKEDHSKIFPYELCDSYLRYYNETSDLTETYNAKDYVA